MIEYSLQIQKRTCQNIKSEQTTAHCRCNPRQIFLSCLTKHKGVWLKDSPCCVIPNPFHIKSTLVSFCANFPAVFVAAVNSVSQKHVCMELAQKEKQQQ